MTDFNLIHTGLSALADTPYYIAAKTPEVIMAKDVFTWADNLGERAKQTVLGLFAAAFIIGGFVSWAKKGFSVKAAIGVIVGVALGIALLSQLDFFTGMFKETSKNLGSEVNVVQTVHHEEPVLIEA